MNETLRVIKSRRSIRLFKDEQIKKEELEAIVEAGLYAPSATNAQNWHFTVIQSKPMIETVNRWILEEIEKSNDARLEEIAERSHGRIFRNAPTVVIASADANDNYGAINAAAATENMLIAAESLGIGSCWIGMVRLLASGESFFMYAKKLQLPKGYAPQNGVTFGYKDSTNVPAPPRRQDSVSYIL